MEIKDVLILCDIGRTTESRIDTAFELATTYNAIVRAVFVPPTQQYSAIGFDANASFAVPLEKQLERAHEIAKSTKFTFISKAERSGITYEWVEDDDIDIPTFTTYTQYSDVAIAPQFLVEHTSNKKTRITDYLSTHIGTPLIVLPNKKKKFPLQNSIVIAWDESPQAARAVHDSLPILKHANEVHVIMVPEQEFLEKQLIISGQGLKNYLSHHGVEVNSVTIKKPKSKIAEKILDAAKSHRADLIVMGVYGHSRIRESVFGGTSKHLLKYSNIPLFVSH